MQEQTIYIFMLMEEGENDELEEMLEEEVDGIVTKVSLNALSEKMVRKTITLEGTIQ